MAGKLAASALCAALLMMFLSSAPRVSAGGGGCSGGGSGGGGGGTIPKVKPPPATCPIDVLKIKVCSPLLGGGVGPDCCPLLGLLGVDVEICLCWAVDVNLLDLIDINIPKLDIVASIMTSCGLAPKPNFTCP